MANGSSNTSTKNDEPKTPTKTDSKKAADTPSPFKRATDFIRKSIKFSSSKDGSSRNQ